MSLRVGLVYRDGLGTGGYPRDIRWLATALASYGISVTLFAGSGSVTEGLTNSVRIEPLENVGRVQVDLYHFFGIFIPEQLWMIRRVLGMSVVVSPMGHLMPYHVRQKMLKKWMYLQAVKPLLRRVKWFHVFADNEQSSVHQYLGKDVLTFEGGLGVFPVPVAVEEAGQTERDQEAGLDLLFFGRNDVYHKGIDILLEGLALAFRNGVNATLTIAGQPWMDSERYIISFIENYGLKARVRVLGPVDEERKYRLMKSADYLVFLSRWDGPPRPIREAISVGTPVIVSPETNMGGLVEEYGAGLQVQLKPEEVYRAISRVSVDRELRRRHRDGVVRLRERLDWRRVAQDYIRGYEQVMVANQ